MTDPANAAESAWERVDTTVPHSARVWNFLLGGKNHFAADREVGERLLTMFPDFAMVARLQREFLRRAVRYLVTEAGVRQFLDLGTGLPTAENTHEVAQSLAPESRVVYVDNDPIVLVHARALLTSTPPGATDYLDADVRDPQEILAGAAKTLDFREPVAVMMLSIAGQVTDKDGPQEIIDTLLAPLVPGSYLALSDGVNTNPALVEAVRGYNRTAANTYQLRSPARLAEFFTGLELVEPGVVPTPEWRPDPDRWDPPFPVVSAVCGVARKP
ncbi:SAM-dependent methyltransferase [Spongiactinospora rosea]|uniref:SAM-dependent methyltransferase n=1 Tax=Spongiactinospora rosea TaxID=2248750 RepID=A0A366LSF2_9ACTN|nr:SAM-dependent methyltransferase [Spongiactinospora rosea]RBQ16319.1 SAM-dependent methyltransferase [Spongiactinospora rosea]